MTWRRGSLPKGYLLYRSWTGDLSFCPSLFFLWVCSISLEKNSYVFSLGRITHNFYQSWIWTIHCSEEWIFTYFPSFQHNLNPCRSEVPKSRDNFFQFLKTIKLLPSALKKGGPGSQCALYIDFNSFSYVLATSLTPPTIEGHCCHPVLRFSWYCGFQLSSFYLGTTYQLIWHHSKIC